MARQYKWSVEMAEEDTFSPAAGTDGATAGAAVGHTRE